MSSIASNHRKMYDGGHIDNQGLIDLYHHYNVGIKNLTPLGPEFRLARNELIYKRDAVESYIVARELELTK